MSRLIASTSQLIVSNYEKKKKKKGRKAPFRSYISFQRRFIENRPLTAQRKKVESETTQLASEGKKFSHLKRNLWLNFLLLKRYIYSKSMHNNYPKTFKCKTLVVFPIFTPVLTKFKIRKTHKDLRFSRIIKITSQSHANDSQTVFS